MAMLEEGLIPDVIDKAPGEVLHVKYSGGEKVNFGHELTPTQVKDPPSVQWTANQDAYYTLAMVDPDAPSRENPTFREVNHWLIGNIHGSNLESGDIITEYLGSGPPKGTGLHRYIFLVFKQNEKLEFDEPRTAKLSRAHRLNFNLRKFVEKYNLGDPIADDDYLVSYSFSPLLCPHFPSQVACGFTKYIHMIAWYCLYFWYRYQLKMVPTWGPILPLLGVALQWKNPTTLYGELSKQFSRLGGKMFTMIGPMPCLLTNDSNLVKFAMTSKSIKKSVVYDLGRIFLGDGIIVSDGEQWKIQRKLLNPAFHYNILEKYVTTFNSQSDRMMKIFENEITKDSTETLKHLIEYALSTAYETSIGTSFEDIKDKMPFYIESSVKNISVMYDRFCNPLYHFDFFYKFSKNYRIEKQVRRNINDLIDTVIQQRKETFSKESVSECEEFENKSRPQLLDLLLQYERNNYFYTKTLLRDEIHTIIIAATDTTSTGLAYTIQLLADHPEVQEKAFREVHKIYLQQSQYATTITDLSKMVYLHAVIQEAMRLYPPVPYITKVLTDDVEYDGIILKKGLTLVLINYELHKNPKYYVEPNKFMPERFLTPKTENSNTYTYIPFSAGPRSCIGNRYAFLSMKTFLSKLLLQYELITVNHQLVVRPEIVLVSTSGFKIRLRKRKCDYL
ncbi:Phosphatidylethanolamine-binding protein [Popillia japonica]|uniref:Phosphatidylethanolamine-binding protein n=1 Tax=Popillia japonica TaxID=7064 RepID=A0AAW1IUV9_POPJA